MVFFLMLNLSFHDWIETRPESMAAGILLLLILQILLIWIHLRYLHLHKSTLAIFDTLPLRVTIMDQKNRVVFHRVEEDLQQELGAPATIEDFKGIDRELIQQTLEQVRQTGLPQTLNYSLNDKNRIARFSMLPHKIFGRDKILWISQDFTQVLQQQKQLDLSYLLLKKACSQANMNFYRYDLNSRNVDILNFDAGEQGPTCTGNIELAKKSLLREDYLRLKQFRDEILQGQRQEFSCDVHFNMDGIKKYCVITGKLLQEDSDHPGKKEIFGIIQDITPVIETRQKFGEMQAIFRSLLDGIPNIAYIFELKEGELLLQAANRKFAQFIGRPEQDLTGFKWMDLAGFRPEQGQQLQEHALQLFTSGQSQEKYHNLFNARGEIHFYHNSKIIIQLSPERRLLLNIDTDLTDLEESKRTAEKSQKQMQELVFQLNNQIANANIVNRYLQNITLPNDFDKAINNLLEIIGKYTQADRCYIFEIAPDGWASNTHEWVKSGITPEISNLQNVNTQLFFPGWLERMSQHRDVIVSNLNSLENPLASLPSAPRQARSLLVSGIWENERLAGFIGIDFIAQKRNFSDSDIETMHNTVNLYLLTKEHHRQMNDITENVKLQRQIVDNMTIPVAIMDLDFNLIIANPAAGGSFVKSLEGKKCFQHLCHCSEPQAWCPAMKILAGDSIASSEYFSDGRLLQIVAQPLYDRTGNLYRILETAMDITEERSRQKKLEEQSTELIALNQQFKEAAMKAQSATQAKSLFLATMSHEIRTPLNAIIGFSELLQSESMSCTERKDYLQSINLAGNALLGLINDILDLSKLEAGKTLLKPAPGDINELCREITAIFRHQIQGKKLTFSMEIPDGLPSFRVDIRCLRQVLLNIFGNAVKFTEKGGVSLKVEYQPENEDSGTLLVQVTDTGIGISDAVQEKIFEPFVQEQIRGSRSEKGSGLGLAIANRLVQLMGGTLTVNSHFGEGSTFIIRLPNIQQCSGNIGEIDTTEKSSPATARETPQRVLIVDDVSMNLKILSAMVRKLGCECTSASSAKGALNALSQKQPDWILTDLWMPEMNGAELAQEIRKNPAWKNLKIVAVTADAENKVNFDNRYFDAVLLKPITIDALKKIFGASF